MWLDVLGRWLFYAVLGGALILMMFLGVGGDVGSGEKTKVRDSTKIIAALSGFALIAGFIGLAGDRSLLLPKLLLGIGFPVALILTLWSWSRLADDLRPRPLGRA